MRVVAAVTCDCHDLDIAVMVAVAFVCRLKVPVRLLPAVAFVCVDWEVAC